MRKFQGLLFVLKQSYICYNIISMTVPLIFNFLNTNKNSCGLVLPCEYFAFSMYNQHMFSENTR